MCLPLNLEKSDQANDGTSQSWRVSTEHTHYVIIFAKTEKVEPGNSLSCHVGAHGVLLTWKLIFIPYLLAGSNVMHGRGNEILFGSCCCSYIIFLLIAQYSKSSSALCKSPNCCVAGRKIMKGDVRFKVASLGFTHMYGS